MCFEIRVRVLFLDWSLSSVTHIVCGLSSMRSTQNVVVGHYYYKVVELKGSIVKSIRAA